MTRDVPICDFWKKEGTLTWTTSDDPYHSDSDCEEQELRSYKVQKRTSGAPLVPSHHWSHFLVFLSMILILNLTTAASRDPLRDLSKLVIHSQNRCFSVARAHPAAFKLELLSTHTQFVDIKSLVHPILLSLQLTVQQSHQTGSVKEVFVCSLLAWPSEDCTWSDDRQATLKTIRCTTRKALWKN